MQKVISTWGLASEKLRCLCQARANAIAQFSGGRFSEGHDQNLRRHQALPLPAMTQYKSHIQGRQSPSFAGTCAGFNQLNALEWQCQHIQFVSVVRAHGASPSMQATRIKSSYSKGAHCGSP